VILTALLPLLFAQAITGDAPVPVPAVLYGAPLDPKPFTYSRSFETGPAGWKRLALDGHALALSYDLSDLRLVTEADVQVPYALEKPAKPIRIPLPALQKTEPPSARNRPATSFYKVELPFPSLPRSTLNLQAKEPVFEREITVYAPQTDRDRRLDRSLLDALFSGTYAHRDRTSPPEPFEIQLPPVRGRVLFIEVHERDNAPLTLGRPEIELTAYRLRFYVERPQTLRLLYGQPNLRAPLYDFALESSQIPEEAITSLELPAAPAEPSPEEEKVKKGRLVFWLALSAAIAVLLFVVARLLASPEAPSTPGPGSAG
jgi:hypothetical protein